MRKLLLLAIAPFFMVGCEEHYPDGSIKSGTGDYQTIKIDSCEYIYGCYKLAHKGNCKFCAERKHTLLHDTIYVFKRDTVYIYKKVKL